MSYFYSYYIIVTAPGSNQVRDYYVKSPADHKNDIVWTRDINEAFRYPIKDSILEKHLEVANDWCKCVAIHQIDEDEQDENPDEAYDRAMGIIK